MEAFSKREENLNLPRPPLRGYVYYLTVGRAEREYMGFFLVLHPNPTFSDLSTLFNEVMQV